VLDHILTPLQTQLLSDYEHADGMVVCLPTKTDIGLCPW